MLIHIQNENVSAEINTLGAELVSFKGDDGFEHIWQGDPKYWGGHAPVLFPIVGALRNGRTRIKGEWYEMNPVSYTHLDVYKRQALGVRQGREPGLGSDRGGKGSEGAGQARREGSQGGEAGQGCRKDHEDSEGTEEDEISFRVIWAVRSLLRAAFSYLSQRPGGLGVLRGFCCVRKAPAACAGKRRRRASL